MNTHTTIHLYEDDPIYVKDTGAGAVLKLGRHAEVFLYDDAEERARRALTEREETT